MDDLSGLIWTALTERGWLRRIFAVLVLAVIGLVLLSAFGVL